MARATYKYDPLMRELVLKDEYERRMVERQQMTPRRSVELRAVERGRWVIDPSTRTLVDADEYHRRRTARSAHYVISDIPEYRSMADGSWITGGRAQHRAHLRQHGCIEVGNETRGASERPKLDRPGHDIKRALEQHGIH